MIKRQQQTRHVQIYYQANTLSTTNKTIKSPCVGLCSTTYGDEVCRGCRRTSDEIACWHGLNESTKLDILQRLDHQLETVLQTVIYIDDTERVFSQAKRWQLNCDTYRSPWSWVFILLVKRAQDIHDCKEYGFHLLVDEKLTKLTRQCLLRLYTLACKDLPHMEQ